MSFGKSDSESKPLTPQQVQGYWDQLNQNTKGRFGQFATEGTAAVDYERLTPEQLQALGGMGATQVSEVERARGRALEELSANPALSQYQMQRARQLTDQDSDARLNAIAKETEAAISSLASQEQKQAYQSAVRNAELDREDLLALANIFFGGKGQTSQSTSINLGL